MGGHRAVVSVDLDHVIVVAEVLDRSFAVAGPALHPQLAGRKRHVGESIYGTTALVAQGA